ncbi:aminotransferase class I/II-fold pyridoxal phosphate-dependent enzyme, partial [uncultured Dubosiella sp.]
TGPLSDRLGIAALRNKEVILKRNREMLARNQQALKEWLRKNDAFSVVCSPLSPVAFLHYSMNMGSVELCERLLQECGVFFVPGSCFKTENYVRLGMGRSCGDFEKGLSVLSKWSNEALKKV